jgi:hypothetical protein
LNDQYIKNWDVEMFILANKAGLIPGLFFEICRILADQIAFQKYLSQEQKAKALTEIVRVLQLKLKTQSFEF